MNYYLGEIIAFAGPYIPENFMLCDGSQLGISQYEALYSVIGNTFGGNATTFNLPNLQGLVVVGVGQKQGGSNYVLGVGGGSNTVVLSEANMPAHVHTLNATTSPATTSNPSGALLATTTATGYPSGASPFYLYTKPTTITPFNNGIFNTGSLTSVGQNAAHNNQQPYLTISYIICVNGLYPTPAN